MGLFKRKITFVSAKCPECGGNLELDSNMATAICQNCGAQCIVENKPKKKRATGLETVIGFVERQQTLRRKDKQEKQRKKEEEERLERERMEKTWWIYLLVIGGFFFMLMIMAAIEN